MDSLILLQTFFLFLLSALIAFLAYFFGYFAKRGEHHEERIGIFTSLSALVAYFLFLYVMGEISHWLPLWTYSWRFVIGWTMSFIFFFFMTFVYGEKVRRSIWNSGRGFLGKSFLLGVESWIITYPCSLLMSSIMTLFLALVLGNVPPPFTQDIALLLKSYRNHLPLLISSIVSVAIFVPVLEEIVFRGFLQNSLSGFLPAWSSIVFSSFVFTLLHATEQQGVGNWQLLPSIFLLSLFLGFLYEREKNLLAPIGLHIAMNSMSLGVMFISV